MDFKGTPLLDEWMNECDYSDIIWWMNEWMNVIIVTLFDEWMNECDYSDIIWWMNEWMWL